MCKKIVSIVRILSRHRDSYDIGYTYLKIGYLSLFYNMIIILLV